MGSAAAWQLAGRGRSVIGLERFDRRHVLGSSHGAARIFRLAYEQDDYVRLAVEALPLWRAAEEESGRQILTQTGSVDFGNERATGRIAAALQRNGAASSVLTAPAARERWPGIAFTGQVLYSPDGGRTDADAARWGLQEAAQARGADLRFGTGPAAIHRSDDGVVVVTDAEEISARVAVVTVNAWAAALLVDVVDLPPIRVTQEQPAFFRSIDDGMPWPSFIHYLGDATLAADFGCYGLASPSEGGVKVGEHGTGIPLDPDGARPPIDPQRVERVAAYVAEHLPGLDPDPLGASPCLYATTPTEDFLLDRVGPLVVGCGFSGHGFKFAPAIGRMLADLAEGAGGQPERFRLPTGAV